MKLFQKDRNKLLLLAFFVLTVLGVSIFLIFINGIGPLTQNMTRNQNGEIHVLASTINVTQDPETPAYQDSVNVTAHITSAFQIQLVKIETNYTGSFVNYTMPHLSGTLQDGVWNYTFENYPLNKDITYQIFATDNLNVTNSSIQYSFGVFDTDQPNITELTRDPANPNYNDDVNITAHITDNTEITIVDIETNSSHENDYLGTYSFTNDIIGDHPSGWTVYENFMCHADVIAELDGHSNVVEIYDDNDFGHADMYNTFPAQSNGSIEFWLRLESISYHISAIPFLLEDGTNIIYISFNAIDGFIRYYDGNWHNIFQPQVDQWYHIKIDWNTSGWQLTTNGTQYGSNYNYSLWNTITKGINRIFFSSRTADHGTDYKFYIDAIDYSWAPGYYLNRNKYHGFLESMTLLSGSSQDGIWNYTFHDYPINSYTRYRIFATDKCNNTKVTNYETFGIFDYDGPSINEITQTPMVPGYQDKVNVTVNITDYTEIPEVYIETNYTGSFSNYTMSLLSGNLQNGIWNFTFDNYPLNENISYKIYTKDIMNNTNSSDQFSFGVFDYSIPNITEVTQDPPNETVSQYWVNVTAHIVDNFEVQIVFIEANHTGSYVNYTMALLSGTNQDGVWTYIFNTFPPNQPVMYRIFARDIVDNENVTNYFNFGLYDTNPPNISIFQIPSEPAYLDSINITAQISDNMEIDTVYFSSNASRDHYGRFTFYFDPNGANPADWAIMEQSGTKLEVQELKAGHRKVVYFEIDRGYSFSSPCFMEYDVWRLNTYGTVEFWVYIEELPEWNSGARDPVFWVQLLTGVNSDFELAFLERENKICYGIGGITAWYDTNATWKRYQWQHYRIVFDGSSGEWDLYQDGVLIANNLPLGAVGGGYQYYTFGYESTHSSGQKGKVWVDAIDFSWEWFYYVNRNMDYDLYNYTMTQLSGSSQDGTWNFTLTEYPVQKTITYRVYASDIAGNLNYSEGNTGTFDYTAPAIETIIQDPTVPTYQDSVNVTAHITENFEVEYVYIETNSSSSFQNYTMTLRSGSLQDGFWDFIFNSYPLNKYIAYRVLTRDFLGHWNSTTYFIFGVFDTNVPNITEVTQDPAIPVYPDKVNITVHVTDNFEIQTMFVETNHTGSFMNYTMSLLSGTTQDGTWNFTFGSYPLNEYIAYRIFAVDVCNNTNATDYLYFGVFDYTGPNIMNVGQIPNPPDYINITAVITEYTQVQEVLLETNHTGIFTNASMSLLGGSLQDGLWNFTFDSYPLNTYIVYRIFAMDVCNNTNVTNYFYFGVFDYNGSNIEPFQESGELIYQYFINVTARITEYTEVQVVDIELNYTGSFQFYSMTLLSGSLQDGIWNFTLFNYSLNTFISYRIFTMDIVANTNSTENFSIYVDSKKPNIEFTQDPPIPIYPIPINITAHITDKSQIQAVFIETDYSGTFSNYSMTFLNGSLQDGYWNFTFESSPLNTYILYRIIAIDIVNNTNSTVYWSFYIDATAPNIVEITQTPSNFTILQPVNVTAHILDNYVIVSAVIESNYTGSWTNQSMLYLSGTAEDSYWQFIFDAYPVNKTIWYRIHTSDVIGNTTISNFYKFGIFPIISYEMPSELELEINLKDREGKISFLFSNTGNTTFLVLNFTINLPTGWNADGYTISVPNLVPGDNVTINFHVTIPDTNKPFEETITIDFNATILETGQLIKDSISIMVTGVKDRLFLLLIIIFGSVASASTLYFVNRKRKQKKSKLGQIISTLKLEHQKLQPDVELGVIIKLTSKLSHKDSKVRLDAVWKLADLGDKRAVNLVLQLLHDPNSAVRAAVAKTLGTLGDSRALLTALTPLMSDPDSLVRKHASEAIEKLHQTIQRTELIEITLKCKACGHEWALLTTRAPSLFYCPECKNVGQLREQFAQIKKSEEATPLSEDSVKKLAAVEPMDVETQQVTKTKPEKRSMEDIITNLETKLQARQGQGPPITEFRCPYCKKPLTPQQVQNLQKGASVSCPGCLKSIPGQTD